MTPTHFTLNEYTEDQLQTASVDQEGKVMVFESEQDARDMAHWMLEGGPEDDQLPLVSIDGWESDPRPAFYEIDDTHVESWAIGWVEHRVPTSGLPGDPDWKTTIDGHGDYENDKVLWERMTAFARGEED